MKKNTGILIAAGVAIVGIAAWLIVGGQPGGDGSQATSIRIAANLPLTGPVAAWSGEFPNGFRFGIEDACKEHGVDPSIFKMDFQDNAGSPAESASVVQKQGLAGFDVYLCGSSESAKAAVETLDPLGVPNFIVAFDPFMAAQHRSRLRIMANSKIEAPLFIQYAKKMNAKSVYIIQLNSAYANEEFGNIVRPALEKTGVKVESELFDFATRDYKSIALKAVKANTDLIFICGYSFHLRPLIADLRTNNAIKDGRVMGVMDVVDFLYDGTPKEEIEGLVFACPIFDIPGGTPGASEWRTRYQARFGRAPSYVPAYAYDNAQAIVRAYKASGNVSVESIRAALPFQGITGQIQLDSDGDIVATVAIARLSSDGKVERVN